MFLLKLAIWGLSKFVPLHSPIAWPDMAILGLVFRGLDIITNFVDWPIFFGAMVVLVTVELGILLFGVWRQLLKAIPAMG
jgi:hypothetical protein